MAKPLSLDLRERAVAAVLKGGLSRHRAAARTVEAVIAAIGQLLETYSPQECANYFTNAGHGRT